MFDIPIQFSIDASLSISDCGNITVTVDYSDTKFEEFVISLDEIIRQEIEYNTTIGRNGFYRQSDKDVVLRKYLLFGRNIEKSLRKHINRVEKMKVYNA